MPSKCLQQRKELNHGRLSKPVEKSTRKVSLCETQDRYLGIVKTKRMGDEK